MALPAILANFINKLNSLGFLPRESANQLINTQADLSGEALEKILLEEHKISEFQILAAKSLAFGLQPFNAKGYKLNEQAFDKLDREFCKAHKILPLGYVGNNFGVAVASPFTLNSVLEAVAAKTKARVIAVLAQEKDVLPHLEIKVSQAESAGFGDVMANINEAFADADISFSAEDKLEEESAPVIQLSGRIIEDAFYSGASDIHIEPMEKHTRIRVRVDGNLAEKLSIPSKVGQALLARLKVMANLDISERRLPQDGRIVFKQFTKKNLDIDLRVSTAPLNHGEGCVMRILDKTKSTLPLPALGYSAENLAKYRELIRLPYGMVLHCGPTGSGKSMTLYSALNEINTPDLCIRTAEDPIEYTLPGICQMQMHRKIGLTFAAALRAFLRQDPDIILVGEIRDKETAQIAVEAALTGHMLFSTLHTNDAPSTIPRLTEMEIEPFMISAALVCVCAQRLMRRACKTCKQQYVPAADSREALILQKAIGWVGPIYRPNLSGCPACGGTGYKGRVGIHELMATSEELVKGINAGYEAAKLKRIAVRNGMKTLHQDSMYKVKDGVATLEESIGTVPADMENLNAIIAATSLEAALSDSLMSGPAGRH